MIELILLLIPSTLFCRGVKFAFSTSGLLFFIRQGVEIFTIVVAEWLGFNDDYEPDEDLDIMQLRKQGMELVKDENHCTTEAERLRRMIKSQTPHTLISKIWFKFMDWIVKPFYACLPCIASVSGLLIVFYLVGDLTSINWNWKLVIFYIVSLSGLNTIQFQYKQ